MPLTKSIKWKLYLSLRFREKYFEMRSLSLRPESEVDSQTADALTFPRGERTRRAQSFGWFCATAAEVAVVERSPSSEIRFRPLISFGTFIRLK
jgi:hypothetical protein